MALKIDLFNHFFPQQFWDEFLKSSYGLKDMGKRVANIPNIYNLDSRLRTMDEFGEYTQLISLGSPPIEVFFGPKDTVRMAKIGNDGQADLVRKYPQRFIGFLASLPMTDPDEAVKEIHRSVTELGAKGIQLYTNVLGKPLDAPEFAQVFNEAARLDVPIWLHPARGASFSDYATESKSKYEIWWTFGWPYETSATMARLVFSGMFDRLPNLKVITHHMGGMIPYFEGRVGYGWDKLGSRTTDEDYESLLKSMKKRPIDYFRLFLADTALFGARAATICGLDFFGLDNVVFASDTPFEPTPGLYIRETIKVIESLDLTADQKDQIYRRNALKLLKMA
ncbi:MAG TPA: amidohydrolase family protein [Bryobacteraceae bacterium]|nr:amidohydrolase family protein [Bryobacteraceae bacterium]